MTYLNPTTGFIVLGGFAILSVAAAVYLTRNSGESAEDLLVARESTAVPIIIVSLIATWLWSTTLMGAAEGGFNFGFSAVWVYGFSITWSLVLMGPILARIRQNFPEVSSYPEYVRYRFGDQGKLVHLVFSVVALAQSFFWAVIQVVGAGYVLNIVFDIPHWQGALLTGLIVTGYVTLGGLRASIFTDFVQMLAIGVIIAVLAPWVVTEIGGAGPIYEGVANAEVNQAHHFVTPEVIVGWLLIGMASVEYTLINQNVWQRIIATDGTGKERLVLGSSVVLWLAIPASAALIGLVGFTIDYSGNAATVLPAIMIEVLPVWGAILFGIAILGAIFSTTDSCLNSFMTIMVSDIYKPYFGSEEKVRNDKSLVIKTKVVMIVTGVSVAIFGTMEVSLLFFSLAVGALAMPLAWPVVLSALRPDFNRTWGAYSVILGVIGAAIFAFLPVSGIWANPPFEPWQGYLVPAAFTVLGPIIGTMLYPDTEYTFTDMQNEMRADVQSNRSESAVPGDD